MSAAGAMAWCPFPDAQSAGEVADRLLDEGLIACANILPEMEARYTWRGTRNYVRLDPVAGQIGHVFLVESATIGGR